MFKELELIKFDFKYNRSFYYTIITTPEFVDFSIFSDDEWALLQSYDSKFKAKQAKLNEENLSYKEVINFLDDELKKNFNIRFRDIEPFDEYEENLKSRYQELYQEVYMEHPEKNISKDKLRLWFVENYQILKNNYEYC